VPDMKATFPEFMVQKGIQVSLSSLISIQTLSAVVASLAVISVVLNTLWQPFGGWFSTLALVCLGGLVFKSYTQSKKINHLIGTLTYLSFEPRHTFVKTQTGQTWPIVLKSVWWHARGFTLIGKLQDPGSHTALTHTFTVWRSKNTALDYRWASICLSNQATFSHVVQAA